MDNNTHQPMNLQAMPVTAESAPEDSVSADVTDTAPMTKIMESLDRSEIRHLCPNCQQNYYRIDHSYRTAVYYPPIIKDGVNINPDRNTSTVYCTCMNCGEKFTYKEW